MKIGNQKNKVGINRVKASKLKAFIRIKDHTIMMKAIFKTKIKEEIVDQEEIIILVIVKEGQEMETGIIIKSPLLNHKKIHTQDTQEEVQHKED